MPLLLQSGNEFFLLRWGNSSENRVLFHCLLNILIGNEGSGINIVFAVFDSCALCNIRNCDRVIAGNNSYVNILLRKILQRARSFGTYLVIQKGKTDNLQINLLTASD